MGSFLSYLPGEWFSVLEACLQLGNHWGESGVFSTIIAREEFYKWVTFSEVLQHVEAVFMRVVTNDLQLRLVICENLIWLNIFLYKRKFKVVNYYMVCSNIVLIPIRMYFLQWDRRWWSYSEQAGNFFSLWALPMGVSHCEYHLFYFLKQEKKKKRSWEPLYTRRTNPP